MRLARLSVVVFCCVLIGAFAKETLSLDFGKAQSVKIGGRDCLFDGAVSADGFMAFGLKGYAIPAEKLVGANQGTVLFECKFTEEAQHKAVMRPIVHLRTKDRTTYGFQYFAGMSANFRAFNGEKSYLYGFDALALNKSYMFGFTWDGNTVRLYQDGREIDEKAQELTLEGKVRNIFIGPYKDGWYAPGPWEDSGHIRSLKVYDTALTPAEIAEICHVQFKPLEETNPMYIAIPAIPANMQAPNMDGQVDEAVWQYAASMPRLIRGQFPRLSGAMPPSDFKLFYDKDNLYLGFTSIFPRNSTIIEGNLRTPQLEPEAWGTESFEFLIETDTMYRFAGNVAGGYCESIPNTAQWNGAWTYRTQRSMKIDDRIHWHGEVAIPWKTIGLDGVPKSPVKLNFCRSWKVEAFGGFSSLNLSGAGYNVPGALITAEFVPSVPVLQVLDHNNPNTGEYEQKFRVASAKGGAVSYDLSVGKMDGSSNLLPICKKRWNLKAGEVLEDKQVVTIGYPDFDCLVYTLKQGNKIVMNEIVPFKLDDNFFDIDPLFFQGRILIMLKQAMMKNKLGASFTGKINLMDKKGKVLSSIPTTAEKLELAFNRDWKGGEYTVAIADNAGKIVTSKALNYPGRGEWEELEFPKDVILPPFDPMKCKVEKGSSLEATVSMRKYSWNKSFLPTQLMSLDENLFAEPAQLLLNGLPWQVTEFQVGMAKKHRAEFTAKGQMVCNKGWIEYDGVQWNEITLEKLPANASLSLRFTLDSRFAKYMHASSSAGWGAKMTRFLEEGTTEVPFFPSLFIGNEEKGICLFAESNKNWNVPAKKAYLIEKHGNRTTITVQIGEKMKATDIITFGFGILGTPIRPFAKNYPFNTVGWTFAAHMNRPGRRPTCDLSLMSARPNVQPGDLGSYFADTNDADGNATDRAYKAELEWCEGSNVRPYPYVTGRYLSNKYPELVAYKSEWSFKPEIALDCGNGNHFIYDCCPASTASNFMVYKIYKMLKRYPEMRGVYFDFGNVPPCSNSQHGCCGGTPLLAQREFHRRVAYVQTLVGIKDPIIEVHNTDSNLLPTYTFVSHLLNGEQVRQTSSTLLHNKKDILDTYGIEMFACELSSQPFGVTNSVYMPLDTLLPKFGGDEPTDAYQFRMGKAEYAATLIHNTIINIRRNHFGMADKLIRTYDKFGVDKAKFIGYWHHPVQVIGGRGIYVSCYVYDGKVLAVVGHVAKAHDNQTFDLKFDWEKLGIKKAPRKAVDTQTAPDPEYQELYKIREKFKVPHVRAPLDLGDYGSSIISFNGDTLRMSLKYHSFAVIELTR